MAWIYIFIHKLLVILLHIAGVIILPIRGLLLKTRYLLKLPTRTLANRKSSINSVIPKHVLMLSKPMTKKTEMQVCLLMSNQIYNELINALKKCLILVRNVPKYTLGTNFVFFKCCFEIRVFELFYFKSVYHQKCSNQQSFPLLSLHDKPIFLQYKVNTNK